MNDNKQPGKQVKPERPPEPGEASAGEPGAGQLGNLSPAEAGQLLMSDPVTFINALIEHAASRHLSDLKEEAELRGALNVFRRAHPEAAQFEPLIMQEVADIIQNDDDGVIDPWDKLLEKGIKRFEEKFRQRVQADPTLKAAARKMADASQAAHVEGSHTRKAPKTPPSFTRDQIGRMSMDEFIAQEEAINEALRNRRIR